MPSVHAATEPKEAELLEAKVRASVGYIQEQRTKPVTQNSSPTISRRWRPDGEGERTRLHVLGEVEHCMYTDYLLQFFRVQPLGPDYAFVTYESSMQFPRASAASLSQGVHRRTVDQAK